MGQMPRSTECISCYGSKFTNILLSLLTQISHSSQTDAKCSDITVTYSGYNDDWYCH